MKILVVDDEQSYGKLLARALKKLGHKALVRVHPQDALEAVREHDVDAVIADIDMPVMNGVELVRAILREAPDLPVAFCTGSSRDDAIVAEAAKLGRVMPKVWTVADVKDLLSGLSRPKPRFARGSQTHLPPLDKRTPPMGLARRRVIRKIRVTCRTWEQVRRLCDKHAEGKSTLTLRGSHRLKHSERLTIALSLPDELVLSIAAQVSDIRRDKSGTAFSIALVGLTPEVCVRLRAMARAGESAQGHTSRRRAPSPVIEEILGEDVVALGNAGLRRQIDALPRGMRPPTGDDTLEN